MFKRFELVGTCGKGLNHRAIVTEYDDSNADLMSYETNVMWLIGGELFRKSDQPQSNTTARHMREFAMLYGFPYMTKAELKEIPVIDPTISR